jgi:hypothetical protein
MSEGRVDSPKEINIFYDEVTCHYHVTGRLKCAMAKQYV